MRAIALSLVVLLVSMHPLVAQSACDSLQLNLDARIVARCNSWEETKPASRAVSATMLPFAAGIPVVLYAVGRAQHDPQLAETGVVMFCADAAALGTAFLLKNIVQRERPWRTYPSCIEPGAADDYYSFPSGHATGATVMATYLSLRYPKWYVIAPSVSYALYTWYARMNLGVHYPSDILVGAVLGAVTGVLADEFSDAIAKRLPKILPPAGIVSPNGGTRIRLTIPF